MVKDLSNKERRRYGKASGVVPVINHVRKSPEAHPERCYFGIENLRVFCVIRAKNMNDAWDILAKLSGKRTGMIDLRPLRCGEFPQYLGFNLKGYILIREELGCTLS